MNPVIEQKVQELNKIVDKINEISKSMMEDYRLNSLLKLTEKYRNELEELKLGNLHEWAMDEAWNVTCHVAQMIEILDSECEKVNLSK